MFQWLSCIAFHPQPCLSSGKISITFSIPRETELKEVSWFGKWHKRYLNPHLSDCKPTSHLFLLLQGLCGVTIRSQTFLTFLFSVHKINICIITWGENKKTWGNLSDLHFRPFHLIYLNSVANMQYVDCIFVNWISFCFLQWLSL